MIITTTFDVPGLYISKILGVISANQVLGNNLVSEYIAALTDIFGGKSGQYRSKLDELIDDAKQQLIEKAVALKANAIVGLSVSTNQISAKGLSMFMITATGTAVWVETDRYSLFEKLHKLSIYHSEGLLSDEEYEYEETKIKQEMHNFVAEEAKTAIDRKRIQEEEETKRKLEREEIERKCAAEYAARIKAQEEAQRTYEKEHADEIKKKNKMLEFIKQEFPKHKSDVEDVDLNAIPNATYQEYIPNIPDLTHYEIMRYLVALGKVPGACKYYCDKYNLSPTDAKDYLLGIYGMI